LMGWVEFPILGAFLGRREGGAATGSSAGGGCRWL
jgi:hypothetical protein